MANVIIKSDRQKAHESQVLASFGVNPQNASREQQEYAREISRRSAEIEKNIIRK